MHKSHKPPSLAWKVIEEATQKPNPSNNFDGKENERHEKRLHALTNQLRAVDIIDSSPDLMCISSRKLLQTSMLANLTINCIVDHHKTDVLIINSNTQRHSSHRRGNENGLLGDLAPSNGLLHAEQGGGVPGDPGPGLPHPRELLRHFLEDQTELPFGQLQAGFVLQHHADARCGLRRVAAS
ncbi:hypothetical protein SAY87_028592 [Trapa incisa]|uniref:Uncharacterized protein n=1 Tax=Trapa incisa TaxID=236973 RepID=A0AAN7L028_9MYRT|nr:hypothetical protein SAY87_028592 [Trapa incisa]